MNHDNRQPLLGRIHPLAAIFILSPFILYAIALLLPTFDDWTYYTAPWFGDLLSYRLLPNASYWRPFDAVFGWLLGLEPRLFPVLNHVFVYAAHLSCTVLVFRLCAMLGFNSVARNTATIFFFISPATLGTVLGIDSLNQAYSQFWGLLALWCHLGGARRHRRTLWVACALVATLCKENGIMFLFIPPVIAYGFLRARWSSLRTDLAVAAAAAIAYLAVRLALTNSHVEVNDEYFENTLFSKLKHIGTFVGMTWIPLDYVSLIHTPSRNWLTLALTLLLPMPFIAMLFVKGRRLLAGRRFLALAAAMCMAALPHLLTLFTAMHAYSGLAMSALIVAYLADKLRYSRAFGALFALFVASCLYVDWHHWQKSYESGLMGQRMGREAIEKTGRPVKRVYSISVRGHERKYSSFCVLPADAFAWGGAAYAASGYKWPEECLDTAITVEDRWMVDSLADRALKWGYERVWLVHGDTVDVIR